MHISTYKPRPVRFLELWNPGNWQIKVYGIAYKRPFPAPELIEAAKNAAVSRLAAVPATMRHYNVGFLGVHHGRTANFVFLDWWADENELHNHVYVSPTDNPGRLNYVTPTGLAACVWDLAVISFERQAWVDTVLCNPNGPDLTAYIDQRLHQEI